MENKPTTFCSIHGKNSPACYGKDYSKNPPVHTVDCLDCVKYKIRLQELKKSKNLPVIKIIEEAAKTFKERQAVYGDNYELAAKAIEAFFPNGIPLKTVQDHERFHIFMLIIIKLSRYANSWNKPHQDSIHDAGIYSFMLEAIDQKQQTK